MLFETAGDLLELLKRVGHDGFQLRHGLRRANAGHHVLTLRVDQEFAPELFFSGGRVAREAHAGSRRIAHVAKHHGLDVRGRAQFIRNLFHPTVGGGVRSPPGPEHCVARHGELLVRVLRERFTGFFLD